MAALAQAGSSLLGSSGGGGGGGMGFGLSKSESSSAESTSVNGDVTVNLDGDLFERPFYPPSIALQNMGALEWLAIGAISLAVMKKIKRR